VRGRGGIADDQAAGPGRLPDPVAGEPVQGNAAAYALSAWREAPFFTARERAALALTEAMTLVHDGHVPDQVYAAAAAEFDAAELSQLAWLVIVINAWNRMGITARLAAGEYDPSA
jgi:alkylhydroperoxidase family enzyme